MEFWTSKAPDVLKCGSTFCLLSYTILPMDSHYPTDRQVAAMQYCSKKHSNVPTKAGVRRLLASNHGCKQCWIPTFKRNWLCKCFMREEMTHLFDLMDMQKHSTDCKQTDGL